MALPFAPKSGSGPNQRGRKWGSMDYLGVVGGLCTILGTVWLGWRYGKFEALWRLWEESEYEVGQSSSTAWHNQPVKISIVNSSADDGAVCLDGSPPAYFLAKGTGEGANNWVLFHEGGGWCDTQNSCLDRSFTVLGSSRKMPSDMYLGGLLGSSPAANPDFYNWNRVLLKYCDGASFNGDMSEPVELELRNGKAATLFYRGQRVWKAVMEELMEIGMKNAQKAFLAGCSAGGVASILHCDRFRDLMPKETIVKCLSDAGFFIDIPDITGVQTIESVYARVVRLHNMAGNLPKSCTSERDETRCMFPEYLIGGLSTPFFMLNSAYDTWSIDNILIPPVTDPEGIWDGCKTFLSACSETQLRAAQGFRSKLLKKLQPLLQKEKHGAFIDSCYLHCQSQDANWNDRRSPKVDSKSIAQVVGDWYFERNSSKVIDCQFPCNPTCGQ